MKKVAILALLPSMLLALSSGVLADDAPAAPAAVAAPAAAVKAAPAAVAAPAAAVKAAPAAGPTVTVGDVQVAPTKSSEPVKDAEKLIDGETETIDNDPTAVVNQLIKLAEEGRWGPFVGLLLMFLIWILRKFVWKLIPKNALPWVTLCAGMVATGAIELSMGVVWWKVLIDSFATSGIAMGFWSLLFKHFLKPAEDPILE